MEEIIQAHKDHKLMYKVRLFFDGSRKEVTFLTSPHEDYVYYYNNEDMVLESFKPWTSCWMDDHLLRLAKGFIAGKGWKY